MAELTREEAEALVRAVAQLAQLADRALPPTVSPLAARLAEHLGGDASGEASVSMELAEVERVNLQLALDAYRESVARFTVIGLASDIGNYRGVSLPAMLGGAWHGPGEEACHYRAVSVDVDATIDCLRAGLILTELDRAPIAALLYTSGRGRAPATVVEVMGTDRQSADRFLRRLRELMQEHNAYRNKVVSFSFGMHGDFGLSFVRLPVVEREQVILGLGELEAIEEHTVGVSAHAVELRAAGQHVKRGLLLYGPPGTGKTHTVAYLVGQMAERTTIILTGGAIAAVGQAGTIARSLQPATIVIEDVDLVAFDRSLPGGEHNALLFQLLNEMDGLAEDADVLFVLTTNRVDVLEPALAARPGRIDQAIELSLPDAPARRRLLELYHRGPLPADADLIVDRLAGAAPAFIKELARRAELIRLRPDGTDRDALALALALAAMVEHATPVLRRSLAAPAHFRAGDRADP